jgi:hypothetical protein
MRVAWRRGGRAAAAIGALALAGMLALPVGPAMARDGGGGGGGGSPSAPGGGGGGTPGGGGGGTPGGGGSTSISGGGVNNGTPGGSGATSSSSPGGSGDGNSGGFGNGGGHGNGGVNLLGSNASSDAPALGLNFDNNSAGLSASVPFGANRSGGRSSEPVTHRALAIPFEHGGDAAGGNAALTNQLIRSVTTTYSDNFVHNLGDSLRMPAHGHGGQMGDQGHPGDPASGHAGGHADRQLTRSLVHAAATPARANVAPPLASRAPAATAGSRFANVGSNALDARLFTVPGPGETRFVPHEIVVGVPAGLPAAQIAAIARRHGLAPVTGGTFTATGLTLQRWRITDDRPIADVIRALEAESGLTGAQPDFRFKLAQAAGLTAQPADDFSVQYAPAKLHLAQAHRLTTGGGVIVAVIDTGIDRTHPELASAIAASFDAVGGTEPPDAHGTGIAGAIVAHRRLVGVAPGARLLAIRAFSTRGPDAEATTMTVVHSITWAVAHGARVINMSFAGAHDPLIARALADARRHGIVLVAAAGNAGPSSPPLYPAADANVIAVSATDVDDHVLDIANRGRQIALAAPGVDVLLPAPHARYQIASGTSFAAAHVAGIAALMLAKNPRLTPDEVRDELVATARDLGPKGRDDMFGAGLADAYKAVVAATHGTPTTVAVKVPQTVATK